MVGLAKARPNYRKFPSSVQGTIQKLCYMRHTLSDECHYHDSTTIYAVTQNICLRVLIVIQCCGVNTERLNFRLKIWL